MRGLAFLGLLLVACGPDAAPPPAPPATASATHASGPPPAFAADMQTDAVPGDDFDRFANGRWRERTVIPADRSSWSSWDAIDEDLLAQKRAVAESAEDPKVAAFYAAYLDEATIGARGLTPLAAPLAAIAAIKDKKMLASALGASVRADVDILNAGRVHTPNALGLWVAEDLDEPTKNAAFLVQGGLAMPDASYYLDPSPEMASTRAKYVAHVEKVLALASVKDATAKAARIVALETKLAASHVKLEDLDNPDKGDNHWTRRELETKAPGLDWATFLAAAKLDRQPDFVVWTPSGIGGLARAVADEPLETWKDYLVFHLVDGLARFLPKAFLDESFDFYDRALLGTAEAPPRWKLGVGFTSAALRDAFGKLFVAKYFSPTDKARAEVMFKNLLAAFDKRIDALSWMAPATRQVAKAKLATMRTGVGYPARWRTYDGLDIAKDDALGNWHRAQLFDYDHERGKLGQPVDRDEWSMAVQDLNAMNCPVRNSIIIPAGILKPPFFDASRAAVFDYGGIGMGIGHEVSHSFDNNGAKFDEKGRKRNWWTAEDLTRFEAAGAALIAQYNAYEPLPGLHVNGKHTLAENIADVAGLAAAFDAYRLTSPSPAAGGYSDDQQFFIAYAQFWRVKQTEASLRSTVTLDAHAPLPYRIVTVRNIDGWYAAFAAKPGQKLYLAPNERVRVW